MRDINPQMEKYLGEGFLSGLLALLRSTDIANSDAIDRCWEKTLSEFVPKIGWYASGASRLTARLEMYYKLHSCLPELQSTMYPELHEYILKNSGAAEVGTRFTRQDSTTGIICDWVILSRCIGGNGGVLFTMQNEHGITKTVEFFD